MKKVTLSLTTILIATALAKEPSAFMAGDLSVDKPYGLTKSEEQIYQNRQDIKKINQEVSELSTKLYNLNNSLTELKDSFDGYKSLYEGENRKIRESISNTPNHSGDILSLEKHVIELNATFSNIESSNKINFQNIEKNSQDIKKAIASLTTLLDGINKDYVSRAEFEAFKKELFSQLGVSSGQQNTKSTSTSLENSDINTLFSDGVKFFKEKNYKEAEVRFKMAVNKNHKPAQSTFYLGEIAYYQKKYEDALAFFKNSVSLNDKAEYMPTLLVHSGISSEKLNDIESAKMFYNILIKNFPNTDATNIAKQNLSKIQ